MKQYLKMLNNTFWCGCCSISHLCLISLDILDLWGGRSAVIRRFPGSSLRAAARRQQRVGCTCPGTAAGRRPHHGGGSAALHPAACCPICDQDNSAGPRSDHLHVPVTVDSPVFGYRVHSASIQEEAHDPHVSCKQQRHQEYEAMGDSELRVVTEGQGRGFDAINAVWDVLPSAAATWRAVLES